MVFTYRWQESDCIDIYVDTDWAGCPRTRKSTSGGCALLGRHTIKTWSSTQASVALSSGEAEFNGVVRGSGVGLGYQSLLRDLGIQLPVRVWTDSSAAVGICTRQGLGKLRHIDTHTLWVQQAVRSRRIELRKVAGDVNPADLFTQHSLTRERLRGLVKLFDCEYRGGRAESAPKARQPPGSKTTMAGACLVEGGAGALGEMVGGGDGGPRPIMPHKEMGKEDMDRVYPAVAIEDSEEMLDMTLDEDDGTLQNGLRTAAEIQVRAMEVGRRRNG